MNKFFTTQTAALMAVIFVLTGCGKQVSEPVVIPTPTTTSTVEVTTTMEVTPMIIEPVIVPIETVATFTAPVGWEHSTGTGSFAFENFEPPYPQDKPEYQFADHIMVAYGNDGLYRETMGYTELKTSSTIKVADGVWKINYYEGAGEGRPTTEKAIIATLMSNEPKPPGELRNFFMAWAYYSDDKKDIVLPAWEEMLKTFKLKQ